MVKLSSEVINALVEGYVNHDAKSFDLPEQLPVKVYREVKTVLKEMGAIWDRKAATHRLEVEPEVFRQQLQEVVDAGEVRTDKDRELFETPPELADRMVSLAGIREGWKVLEPSAGRGAILNAIEMQTSKMNIYACENDVRYAERLSQRGFNVYCGDFLGMSYRWTDDGPVDAVVMNPPFSLVVEHTRHAWDFVRPGGVLVGIAPVSVTRGNQKKYRLLRDLIETYGYHEELDRQTFVKSGTSVGAILFALTKPTEVYEVPEPVLTDEENADLDAANSALVERIVIERGVEQPRLIPEQRPEYHNAVIHLDQLPPNEALVGDPPSRELIANIQQYGLMHPILVVERGVHQYVVTSGRRRIKAFRHLRDRILEAGTSAIDDQTGDHSTPWDFIPAQVTVVDGPISDAMLISANATTRPNPVAEYLSLKALVDQGASEYDISLATGLTTASIKRRLRLGRAPEPFIQAAMEGRVSAAVVEAVAGLPAGYHDKLVERLNDTSAKPMTVAEVNQVRYVNMTEQFVSMPSIDVPDLEPEVEPHIEAAAQSYGAEIEREGWPVFEREWVQTDPSVPEGQYAIKGPDGPIYFDLATGQRVRQPMTVAEVEAENLSDDELEAGAAFYDEMVAKVEETGQQIAFYDAVRDDPTMTDAQKIHWLYETAKDYDRQLSATEPLHSEEQVIQLMETVVHLREAIQGILMEYEDHNSLGSRKWQDVQERLRRVVLDTDGGRG